MAKCSKCGFIITTEYLAAHEWMCGGKATDKPKGGRYTEAHVAKLEAQLAAAKHALEQISARSDLYHGWQTERAQDALEAMEQP